MAVRRWIPLNEAEVFDRYRFVPETIIFLISLMQDQLTCQSHRNNPLTPLYQVLVLRNRVVLHHHWGHVASVETFFRKSCSSGDMFSADTSRNSFDCLAEMRLLALKTPSIRLQVNSVSILLTFTQLMNSEPDHTYRPTLLQMLYGI